MAKPSENDYPDFFKKYVDLVDATDYITIKNKYFNSILSFIDFLPESKENYSYDIGKWSLKEVIQHLTDTNRVFSYRALRISRNDKTNLPGFDEKLFAQYAFLKDIDFTSVLMEFKTEFINSSFLYSHLSDEQFNFSGFVNNKPINVNAILFTSYGHILHHIQIIKERYLH